MSLIDIDQTENKNVEKSIPAKLAQAIASPLFPEVDSLLRTGRHISGDEIEYYEFLLYYQEELELFYSRYNVEFLRAPEGFFYLLPRSTTLISRSVLSELEMIIGKILCYLYLSPERLAHEGIFTFQEMYEELLSLVDENKLLKYVNQRSAGSDLDRQKLQDKVKTALKRLKRLGMITFIHNDFNRFRITESVFRFGIDVKSGEDLRAAQLNMIQRSEAASLDTIEMSSEENEESLDSVLEEEK